MLHGHVQPSEISAMDFDELEWWFERLSEAHKGSQT